MKKLLSLLLAMVMILSLFAGCSSKDDKEEKNTKTPQESTGDQTDPTDDTTQETEPKEREPLIPPLEEDADVLTFRYDEKYLELYYEKLEQYKETALESDDYADMEALDLDMEELSQYLMDQYAIAMVLTYCDTEDEDASDCYLEMTDMITEVQEKTTETLREIYKSDSKIKDEIFADWTEDEIQAMLDYNSEVKEIEQRYNEIEVEYQDLEDDELEEGIVPLYTEVVANYNRLAEIYGYETYYEYAYAQVYNRDYSSEEVAQMRQYVKTYIVPVCMEAMERFYTELTALSDDEGEELIELLDEDYDELPYMDAYLDQLPEEVAADMRTVFDGNSIFPKSRHAMPGAFTTMINRQPFCFFSRDYRNSFTLVHEMGHYYGGLFGDLEMMPLDLAEIQSQGNEWLMLSYLEEELDRDVYECYLDYRIFNDLTTILICMIVDEFEEQVYHAENIEKFDADDFDDLMQDVLDSYGDLEFLEAIADPFGYWRLVALEHPVYYISYATSLVPSINIFFEGEEDWDHALEIYLGLTRDLDAELTFTEALDKAGLNGPFDADFYESLVDYYEIDIEE